MAGANDQLQGRMTTCFNDRKEYEKVEINDGDREFPRAVEQRNWADLPRDVLSIIFNKITSVDILESAQFVCRPWRQISYEPELWRHIVVNRWDSGLGMNAMGSLAMLAVDRSQGCVEDFHLENIFQKNNELIGYMSIRTTKLRRLRLIEIRNMSELALAQAIRNFSLLEELDISFCKFSYKLVEVVGPVCPQLKSFRLNGIPYMYYYQYDYEGDIHKYFDVYAFSIAKHMQQLQRLQLIGNYLTNISLLAILNNCSNLQCLDIRACFNVNFDENLRRKCAKFKELRLPRDSVADFEFIGNL